MLNGKALVVGAVTGFVSALLVDLNNWRMAPEGQVFNWKKAAIHWATGAVSGAMAAAGLSTVTA